MILDKLENIDLYKGISPLMANAVDYIKATDLAALEVGRHDIDGDNLFVLIQEYDTKPEDQCKYESHKKYIDIQYIISGRELMGYAPIEKLTNIVDHTPGKDTINYKDGNKCGSLFKVEEKMYGIFYPADGHMPNIADGSSCKNKKAVVKVLVH